MKIVLLVLNTGCLEDTLYFETMHYFSHYKSATLFFYMQIQKKAFLNQFLKYFKINVKINTTKYIDYQIISLDLLVIFKSKKRHF